MIAAPSGRPASPSSAPINGNIPPSPPPTAAAAPRGAYGLSSNPSPAPLAVNSEHLKYFTNQMAELMSSWSRGHMANSAYFDPRLTGLSFRAAAMAAAFHNRTPSTGGTGSCTPAPVVPGGAFAMGSSGIMNQRQFPQPPINYDMFREFSPTRASSTLKDFKSSTTNSNPVTSIKTFRCGFSSCGCERFQPREKRPRSCEICKHGWIAHAVDKLGLSQFYSTTSNPLVAAAGVEAVSPSIVFDVASLVLYGTHAIPVRLKILMDRLFSVLREEEVVQILKGYGWSMEDYQRGYILKDHRGTPLDRWTMCSKEEEPLVLQQFLRFGETRPITQQLLIQEFTDRQNEEQRAKAHHELKKLIERHSAAVSAASRSPPSPPSSLLNVSHNGSGIHHHTAHESPLHHHSPSSLSVRSDLISRERRSSSSSSPVRRSPPPPPSVSSPLTTNKNSSSLSPSISSNPVNGTSTVSSSSPLNRLQNMQPFDYRTKEHGLSSPDPATMAAMAAAALQQQQQRNAIERPVPPTISPMRMPPVSSTSLGLPLLSGVPPTLASYHNALSASKAKREQNKSENSSHSASNALNLSRERDNETPPAAPSSQHSPQAQPPQQTQARKKSNPHAMEDGIQQEMKKKLRDNIGISYVSPTTGKKRVQCNVCLKTFCDKGALKIHFSAVHLREMHKCSVEGCNMMFSSRRSRNRHSANPNPKLHTPHLRRKISPHDGRTHQGPYLPGLAALTGTANLKDVSPIPPINQLVGAPSMSMASPFPGVTASSIPPELQHFQRQQMELQRLHEMKMSSLYSQPSMLGKRNLDSKEDPESQTGKRTRLSDSENEDGQKNDDDRSIGEQSGKDEASSGTHSIAGGRKRKSQNPTRITTLQSTDENDGEEFSSDDDDEGFENPMEDNDDDLEDEDEDDTQPGAGGGSGASDGSTNNDKQNNNNDRNNGDKDNVDESQKSPKENDSRTDKDDDGKEAKGSEEEPVKDADRSLSPNSENVMLNDIPVDKENPRRCVECGEEFPNHFAVKTHFQDVHLKLMHKCTIEGCNAGFPSKRSRDRHSSNLNLHRKLLSTSSSSPSSPEKSDYPKMPLGLSNPSYQSELLARIYANSGGNETLVSNFMKTFATANGSPEGLGMLPNLANLGFAAAASSGSSPSPFSPFDLESKIKAQRNEMKLLAEVGNHS